MSLEERLAAFRSKFLSQVPEEIQQLMRSAASRLEESGAALRAARAGDRAPEVLSDTGNELAKSFGLDFELAEELRPIYKNWGADLEKLNGDPPFSLPMAATYVIGTDGTIIESFVDTDYTERMEPQAVIDALQRRA